MTSGERSRQNTTRRDTEQRRVAVSESRSNTHSLLSRSHLERIEAARQMMSNTCRAVKDICRATRSTLGEFATDLRGAHQAWAGVKKALMPEAALVEELLAEEAVTAEEEVGAEEPAQKERVFFAIQRHPEGLSIVDIGNELGVDWRSLTGVVRFLVEERKIERIDSMYYPGEKTGEEEI